MASTGSKTEPGSVGTIETRFLNLTRPLQLDCGRELHPIQIAYETYGTLSPAKDNVILVCHALSGDAHAAGFAKAPTAAPSPVVTGKIVERFIYVRAASAPPSKTHRQHRQLPKLMGGIEDNSPNTTPPTIAA